MKNKSLENESKVKRSVPNGTLVMRPGEGWRFRLRGEDAYVMAVRQREDGHFEVTSRFNQVDIRKLSKPRVWVSLEPAPLNVDSGEWDCIHVTLKRHREMLAALAGYVPIERASPRFGIS